MKLKAYRWLNVLLLYFNSDCPIEDLEKMQQNKLDYFREKKVKNLTELIENSKKIIKFIIPRKNIG